MPSKNPNDLRINIPQYVNQTYDLIIVIEDLLL